jgi:Cu/Ag efflux protein CusF
VRSFGKSRVKTFSAISPTLLLVVVPISILAAERKDGVARNANPSTVIVEVVKVTGTVKAIDQEKKIVSIEGAQGRNLSVNATNVRNLDQVKVGDKVNMEFVDELALFIRRADSPPRTTEAQAVALAPKGQKPSGLVAQTIKLTGNVESIDSQKRTISLKGPAGNVRTFKVDQSIKNLDEIKNGDQVVLRFTEAVALFVGKA